MSLGIETEVIIALRLETKLDSEISSHEFARLRVRPNRLDRVVLLRALLVNEFCGDK